jgi:hypothetical protein
MEIYKYKYINFHLCRNVNSLQKCPKNLMWEMKLFLTSHPEMASSWLRLIVPLKEKHIWYFQSKVQVSAKIFFFLISIPVNFRSSFLKNKFCGIGTLERTSKFLYPKSFSKEKYMNKANLNRGILGKDYVKLELKLKINVIRIHSTKPLVDLHNLMRLTL